ncbi:MAG TPA: MAPEG family protein [Labilithrix sp.]|jgi:uncharacterized MAPEG superfamily protein
MANNPSFVVYAVSMMILCLNVVGLWIYSGVVRARTKTARNPEDVGKKATLTNEDPPDVARVLRAHRNAADNILPFAILAFILVQLGATPVVVGALCGVFTLARLAHSASYLGEKQPWRSIFFAAGAATTLTLVGFLVRQIVVSS